MRETTVRTWLLCSVVLALAAMPILAADEKELDLKDLAVIADAVRPSLVKVEIALQYDKGEAPPGYYVVAEERPMEIAGYLVSPTQVVCEDPLLQPRFIKSLAVRFGDEVVDARPTAYGRDDAAMLLQLDHAFKNAKPPAFNADAKPPLFSVKYAQEGDWSIKVSGAATAFEQGEGGRRWEPSPKAPLCVDKAGVCVGIALRGRLPIDGSWKGSPLKWAWISDQDMKTDMSRFERVVDQGVLRVTLKFRSPKARAERYYSRRGEGEEAEQGGESNVFGVLIEDRTVLVCADLKPKATARLEAVQVHRAGSTEAINAQFAFSLRDYGALIVNTERPLDGVLKLSDLKLLDLPDRSMLYADVRVQGETQVNYLWHNRIQNISVGWRRQLYPGIEGRELRGSNVSLFDPDAALFALPLSRREKVSEEHRYGADTDLVDVAYLRPILADLPKYADANNVPLTEEEENRLAWIGVELQPLNQELARANNVSALTQDGQTGAIVTHVYAASPAGQQGIAQGDILLRLHVAGEPTPVEVKVEPVPYSEGFPWDRYDELSEQYYDRIPHPWPSVENDLTRKLTDAGFGKKFTAELFHDGKVIEKSFVIVQSAPHYDSAPRHKSTPLGLTVRDLTYEVRRYFRKADKDPGVIVSKVEPGSKASVAGLKPYEIVAQVNGQPVANVREFEKSLQSQKELRLSVERMNKGRLVKITMAAEKPVEPPAVPTK